MGAINGAVWLVSSLASETPAAPPCRGAAASLYEVRLADLLQRERDLGRRSSRRIVTCSSSGTATISRPGRPAERLGPDPDPPSDESAPVLGPAQRTLEPGDDTSST